MIMFLHILLNFCKNKNYSSISTFHENNQNSTTTSTPNADAMTASALIELRAQPNARIRQAAAGDFSNSLPSV